MTTRLLPLGSQDFEDIRKRGCLYVDKTAMLYRLATTGKVFFLSRPRRFGKSLLVSTLDALFSGKKDLFKGLSIYDEADIDWAEHPVVRVDFAKDSYGEKGKLEEELSRIMKQNCSRYGIEFNQSNSPSANMEELLARLHDKYNRQVVVLVDEYDKPVLDALFGKHEADNCELLRSFYSPLKSCDADLKFVFLTGITKVSHVNIFSGLNQLNDISLADDFSAICGITADELTENFEVEIKALAENNDLTYDECLAKLKGNYDPGSPDLTPILYQSGYLTIKGYDKEDWTYSLGFPNNEVEDGLLRCILPKYVSKKHEDDIGLAIENIRVALKDNDTDSVMKILSGCIGGIPTIMKESTCENYYETVVNIIFRVTGCCVNDQMPTPCGRSDVVVRTKSSVYILELKMDNATKTMDGVYGLGFRQIEERGYAVVFGACGLPIHRIVLVFSSKKKGLVGWKEAD